MGKLVWVLQSRKFWAAIITIAVTVGLLDLSDAEQTALATTLITIAGSVYALAVALEDGLSAGAVARWFDAEGDGE